MAAPAAAPGAPLAPLTLAPLERPAFAALFAAADPAGSGIITGAAAVDFFGRSRPPLAPTLLGAIWSIADRANNGFLGKAEWAAAMRLIGHAQRGTPLERLEAMLSQPGPPPAFDGVVLPGAASAPGTPARNGSISGPPGALATITPADRARYTRIFASAGPQNGMIDGEKAKGIFVRSKLPFEQLGAIWNLADTRARGALDLTDFIIGMHFLQATMNGSLATLPVQLPPGLYEQASGGTSLPLQAQNTGGSASGALPRQLTGSGGYLPRQLTGQQGYGTPGSPQASGIRAPGTASSFLSPQRTGFAAQQAAGDWIVSAADKAKADRFFDGLDTERKGTLEGQAAVPFFMQSGLPEATLAHVWDLSDITQSGSLSREEFAVAMHLINGALAGQQMPQELPEALIPPTLRGQNLPAAVNPQESDTQRDLFSLMDDDPAPLPVNTASAFITPAASAAPARAAAPKSSGPFDDDFFGQPASFAAPQSVASPVLSPAPTGTAAARAAASAVPATPINDAGAEAGNKRLAIDSTQKSVKDLQAKRTNLEGSVASSASSIAELESRLASLRTTHEAETSAVRALEERASKQAAELKTLREDVIRNESELSALRAEKDEVEQTVMRDREDVRDMKKRMSEVQNETIGLKSQLEKLRKEARQQKGLVAISKKQLATAEGESEKLRGDIAAVEAGETAVEEVKSPAIEPIGIKSPEAALSPAASVRSTNPFDRFNPVSSPSSPATHNNAALALGGAAAGGALGLGAAAAVHSHDEAPSSTRAVGAPEGADPFGVPQTSQDTQPDAHAPTAPSAALFDDSFGNDFDAPAAAAPASSQAAAPAGSAFDDAFADFDDDKPSETAVAALAAAPAPATNDTLATQTTREQSFDDFEASFAPPGALDSTGSVVQSSAPQEEASAPAPTADEIATDADVIDEAPTADKGKGPAAAHDDDDSSDEDEGPEDLEAPRTASPDEAGFGKSTDSSATAGGGPAAAGLPTAQNVNVAAQRFPELEDSDAAAVVAGSSAGQPHPTSSSDAFLATTAPVSSQHTGASGSGDAFEDALTGEAPGTASAAPSGALGASSSVDRSVSPNKTRRAPPPAPMRSNSNAGASPFDAPATLPTATLPTTAAPTHAPQTASFDDFDAAFEDLGPVSSAAPTSTAPAAGAMGFDDAFGDADDFDFVPSFDNASKAPAPAAAPADAFNSAFPPAAANDAQTGGFGFDDFAASFGDPPAGAAAAGGSGAGSGFSFADEFNPGAAASAAPPVPARSQTSGHKATPSGAEPDDAGPVKSLTSMGFDREKVIRALEASNYKVDRALEKLLASA